MTKSARYGTVLNHQTDSERNPTRIAVTAYGDPRSPTTWSGTPASLTAALERNGVDVAAINVALPGRSDHGMQALIGLAHKVQSPEITLRACYRAAGFSSTLGVVRSRVLRARASEFRGSVATIQIGTSYQAGAAPPVVTYEDMTVIQALKHNYLRWDDLSAGSRARRIEFQRSVYQQAIACCFMTNWAAQSAIRDFQISPKKVHVVGVGANHVVEVASRAWDTPRFLFIGNDWVRKNGARVIRGFTKVREQHPTATLDLVGHAPNVIQDGITRHGPLSLSNPFDRSMIESLLRKSTCFVLPSLHEPAGIAVVEAAHAGLPSLVSAEGGSAELVGSGGLVVRPDDQAAVTRAMLSLADSATASQLGSQAKAHALHLTWDAVAHRLLQALALRRSLPDFEALSVNA